MSSADQTNRPMTLGISSGSISPVDRSLNHQLVPLRAVGVGGIGQQVAAVAHRQGAQPEILQTPRPGPVRPAGSPRRPWGPPGRWEYRPASGARCGTGSLRQTSTGNTSPRPSRGRWPGRAAGGPLSPRKWCRSGPCGAPSSPQSRRSRHSGRPAHPRRPRWGNPGPQPVPRVLNGYAVVGEAVGRWPATGGMMALSGAGVGSGKIVGSFVGIGSGTNAGVKSGTGVVSGVGGATGTAAGSVAGVGAGAAVGSGDGR